MCIYTHPSVCALDFMLPACKPNVAVSPLCHIKGSAGLLYGSVTAPAEVIPMFQYAWQGENMI